MNDKLLYRIPAVAEHLSISRSKVYELLKSGELRSVHIDRTRLVRARDLQAYVDSLAAALRTADTSESQIGPDPRRAEVDRLDPPKRTLPDFSARVSIRR